MKRGSFLLKVVAIISALSFAIGVFGACDGKGKGDNFESESFYEFGEYTKGLHVFNKVDTGKKITDEYKILVADDAEGTILRASSELQTLFLEGTGIYLELITESMLNTNDKYISLGNTSLAKRKGVVCGEEFNSNGYIIKTIDDNVYINSQAAHGVIWGCYEFLTQTIGYNCVAYDTWTFDSNIESVPLYNFDIKDNPDVELRLSSNGVMYTDKEKAGKLRMLLPHSEVYLASELPYHNYFYFVPKEMYQATHPGWYSADGTQLCLTAHGNEAEFNALVDRVTDALKKEIEEEPEKKLITFTQEDYGTWCGCEACDALRVRYGTDSASNIIFINKVAEKIENWLNEEHNGREVIIAIFAYYKTVEAPVKQNEDGSYSPIDESVICRDNVAIFYAPITAKLVYGFDEEENVAYYEILKKWAACCDKFGYWGYSTNYTSFAVPYNCFTSAKGIYRGLLELAEPIWVFDQGQSNGIYNHTGFTHFKIYLESQWLWDINRDYETLKKNFFDVYFGEASSIMQEFYDDLRMQLYYLAEEKNIGTTIYENLITSECFPYMLVEKYMKYIDEAYAAIEGLKETDPTKYELYYDHICLESISPRILLLKLYSANFSSEVLREMKDQLKYDAQRLNYTGEYASLEWLD